MFSPQISAAMLRCSQPTTRTIWRSALRGQKTPHPKDAPVGLNILEPPPANQRPAEPVPDTNTTRLAVPHVPRPAGGLHYNWRNHGLCATE
ncbi:hypothetical protein BDP81DRAFT_414135 [Colletotrichum phormii]|uniref:Uncharacterized protein n=1 Tax=Colletotrichum phormii TaxID=359342 RepID=A0AAJ0A415_9PEZI|nr:uncharacterized protein BDP81DRAFT_414135 [Colletotrichum phormii]KAK1656082.1 hypothetical protein BDP81DRAFT_414135 [Colletotrichum phormii]